MSFNIHQLDTLSYDEAEPILDEYINSALQQFVKSPEGKAYVKQHPVGGQWIGEFISFGYLYGESTLPKMSKGDVQVLMEQIIPRKLTLLDPTEAEDAIPELIAFWEFLQRQYKFRSAGAIVKYLKTITDKFPAWMGDPAKGGFAKQFILSGQAAGFDMMTEEGVQAYQEQHNQKMRGSNATPIPLPGGMPAFMSDEVLSNLGNIENLDALPAQLQNLLGVLSTAMAEGKLPTPGADEEANSPFLDFDRDLQNTLWQQASEALPSLAPEAIEILTQQLISDTTPGTILRDFHTLLEAIGEKGTSVSSKQNTLPAPLLVKLNQQLSEPIQIDMQRPVQKSYPAINGLYLLLRATGIGQITGKGSKRFLVLEPTLLNSWKSLNPTEQYFSLLEAWLIRASQEILGDHRSPFNEGTKCVKYWSMLPEKGSKFKNYGEQQTLNYWPELHNLALLKLFGLLEVESGKPEAGKGWRIKQVKPLPFGTALMQGVMQAFMAKDMLWEFEDNPSLPYGELQPVLQPCFPEWQNSLAVPAHDFRQGVHLFKVALDKSIWRRIAISAELPLANLSTLILEAFEFDSDHLDMFLYKDYMGRTLEVKHPFTEESPTTEEVRVGDVPIGIGNSMTYVFDFGDWWEFEVQLEQVQSDDRRDDYEEILEANGAAPPQYPDWDGDEH